MTVRKAVIPAAGLGTRFLPASKSMPKEMLPVIDKPGLQYIIEELTKAGLDDILIVTSRGKTAIEDHFDRSLELEHHLEEAGKTELLEMVRAVAELATVHSVRQKEPRGFGHAVLMAREHVADNPFAVIVGDEIIPEARGEETPFWPSMIEAYERTGSSVIAVQHVPREEISSLGVIDPAERQEGKLVKMNGMVEKPATEDAPSELASFGAYVFSPAIFDALDRTTEGVGGEIQLTDAINLLAQTHEVYAFVHDGPVYDCGKVLDYLKAVVELSLRRDDLAKPFSEYLGEVVARGS
jgi:UTP--glucose-1-phosphate uridylyltransferase